MRALIQRHPFWTFYTLAVSIFAGLIAYMVVLEVVGQASHGSDYSLLGDFRDLQARLRAEYPVLFHHRDSWVYYVSCYFVMPLATPFFFLPGAPTVSALAIVALNRGKRGVLALIRLYKPIQGSLSARQGLVIYAALLGGIALMTSAACLREYYFGDPARAGAFLEHLGVIDVKTFLGAWIMALFFNQGAALEELGWRGYALPMLIRRLGSPLGATIVLGVLWALWHFPRELPELAQGGQSITELLRSQAWFILSCVSMSIVASYFVNITGGSVLPAIMIHGSLNHVNGMYSANVEGLRVAITGEGPLMWFVAALVVLAIAGKDLGWKRRQALHGGQDPSDAWVEEPARL